MEVGDGGNGILPAAAVAESPAATAALRGDDLGVPVPEGYVIAGDRIYRMRTSAGCAPCRSYPLPLSAEDAAAAAATVARGFDLGPGSFRSRSRELVDRNKDSRENLMRAALEE